MSIFRQKNGRLKIEGISQKLSKKNEFLALKKCQFFVKKCQIFQKNRLKIVKIFPNFAFKMSIEINWNFSKNEFFALKTVEFCSKIANFAGKKVKVFPKFVKNARKKIEISNFFPKN